jgi:hypothetical protein
MTALERAVHEYQQMTRVRVQPKDILRMILRKPPNERKLAEINFLKGVTEKSAFLKKQKVKLIFIVYIIKKKRRY